MQRAILFAICLVVWEASGRSLKSENGVSRIEKVITRERRGASNADIAITEHNNRKLQGLLRQLVLHRLLENMTKRETTSIPIAKTSAATTKSSAPTDEVYRLIDYKRDLMSRVQDLRALVGQELRTTMRSQPGMINAEIPFLFSTREKLDETSLPETDAYELQGVAEQIVGPYEDQFDYVPASYDIAQ